MTSKNSSEQSTCRELVDRQVVDAPVGSCNGRSFRAYVRWYGTPPRSGMKNLVTFKTLGELAPQTSSGSWLYALLSITGLAAC